MENQTLKRHNELQHIKKRLPQWIAAGSTIGIISLIWLAVGIIILSWL